MRASEVGAWLFRNRGWLPVPLIVGLFVLRPSGWAWGLPVLAAGEALRLWAVGHIGLPSRTRGADVGPLVDTGPYARTRNPLYLGNQLLFLGLGLVFWPGALVVTPLLALHYAFIVRWEEANLAERLGAPYRDYCARVPRWLPTGPGRAGGGWSAARALRSERTTLVLLGLVLGLAVARAAG